jgi:hypothetical protein
MDKTCRWRVGTVGFYKLVEDGDIRKNVDELRNIPGAWKQLDDPLAELDAIKEGRKPQ